MSDTFNGFPRDAFAFFSRLARNNNRDWFQAHRELYEQACREPMKQLIAALGADPARTKITRINRDMRFARGQAPYRTHIAVGVAIAICRCRPKACTSGPACTNPKGRRSNDSATRSLRTLRAGRCRRWSRRFAAKAIGSTLTIASPLCRVGIVPTIRVPTCCG